ncbi:NHLP bacteriocin system secretion protein [Microcoleus sp. herbarium19]|uniref:NHLP bacteriocin system secretion protein n=1 Tax=unclassified Microcoleus TaxID=2642155 RepID=UPI002FCECD6F
MQVKQNKLFTIEAIDRLSSPERLDQMMQVVSPRSWLPLTAIGCLVAAAGVWSAIGRIPLTVSGQGVLLMPRHVVQFQAANSGQLVKLNIKPGDVVKRGQEIGRIDKLDLKQQLGQEKAKLAELQGQKQDTNRLQQQQIALELKMLEQQQKDLQESLNRESVAPVLHQQSMAALEQKRQSLEESLPREQIAPILRQQTLAALAEKRQSLEESLRREQVAPVLRQQTLAAIAKKRDSLLQRKQHINSLVETLQQRFETRRVLYEEERAISQDLWLQARQEFVDSQMQLADIKTQLKELDVQQTNSDREYLQNLNKIDELKNSRQQLKIETTNTERDYLQNVNRLNEIKNNLQELKVQKSNTERDYLQNLNKIDEIKTKIKDIETQAIKLAQQDLEKSIAQTNQIQEVKRKIAHLQNQLATESKVTSQYDGRVLEVSAVAGQMLNIGTKIGTVEAKANREKMVSLVYLADKDGKQIKPGMTVQVTPSVVKRERYGGIVGKITQVSPFPVTNQDMSAIIGNENLADSIAKNIAGGGAPVQVFVELQEDPNTFSGYKWSSSNGPPLKISPGTTALVRVQIGQLAPISYVIPILRSLTGVY